MKYFFLAALCCNLILFNSCTKYKTAPAAFFLKPSLVSVVPTSTLQGSASHKITDLYLYIDGNFKGAYQVGNLIPITTNNKPVNIVFYAGIKNNGIKDLSITWLLYDKVEFDTLVETGKTIERPLAFKYNPNTKFVWTENFDNLVGVSLIKSNTGYGSDTTFKIASPANSFEGKSIELGLTGSALQGLLESSIYYTLPTGNSNVYLEINYKCDAVFEVGLSDGVNLKSALNINPSSAWNKIYIQLSDAINREPSASQYKIYFKLPNTNEYPNPHVWLDNIKLIYL